MIITIFVIQQHVCSLCLYVVIILVIAYIYKVNMTMFNKLGTTIMEILLLN